MDILVRRNAVTPTRSSQSNCVPSRSQERLWPDWWHFDSILSRFYTPRPSVGQPSQRPSRTTIAGRCQMFHGKSGSSQRRRSQTSQIAQAYRTAHEILSAALALGLLVGAGYWLDRKVGWAPALTICGACIGFVVAGVSLRTLLRRLDQESAQKKAQKSGNRESQSE